MVKFREFLFLDDGAYDFAAGGDGDGHEYDGADVHGGDARDMYINW